MTSGILKQWPCELTLGSLDNEPGSPITQQEGLHSNLVSQGTGGLLSFVTRSCTWKHGLQVVGSCFPHTTPVNSWPPERSSVFPLRREVMVGWGEVLPLECECMCIKAPWSSVTSLWDGGRMGDWGPLFSDSHLLSFLSKAYAIL